MTEIFENYSELMPKWANKGHEEDLGKAVNEYEGQQINENTKRRMNYLGRNKKKCDLLNSFLFYYIKQLDIYNG